MQVVWLKTALNNLDDIAAYISKENPVAAAQVAEAIVAQINQLKSQPALGRPGRVLGTRELVITNTHYLVPYRIKNNAVEVLRIFHTSRKLPAHW
ncbi:MAG TPA: type II toxin-antitoxin system RelE/ParE family toxin [Methylophilaceae bacterium]|nr:type II toxin-antitoxin system RelE/ParE family toxin [Methylophilaceae bacterium]